MCVCCRVVVSESSEEEEFKFKLLLFIEAQLQHSGTYTCSIEYAPSSDQGQLQSTNRTINFGVAGIHECQERPIHF